MGSVSVQTVVAGTQVEVAERWSDTTHWPDWMDELEEVLEVSPGYPALGATVRWRSLPNGRGEVTETVVEYSAGEGVVSELADRDLTAVQTVTFSPVDGGVLVALVLEYRLSKRSPLTFPLDRFFVRPAMRTALTNTLERFSGQMTAKRHDS